MLRQVFKLRAYPRHPLLTEHEFIATEMKRVNADGYQLRPYSKNENHGRISRSETARVSWEVGLTNLIS